MAIVDFNSSTWNDPWVRKLPKNAKILFLYLWTNNHKNLVAIYSIDPETISFETGLSVKDVMSAFEALKPKVLYDPKTYHVWVVNHVRHQFMRGEISPKIVAGIKKCLLTIKHPFAGKFLTTYKDIQGLQELTDKVSIGYLDSGYPTSEGEGESEGGDKGEDVSLKRDKQIFGKFKNVKLTEDEHQELENEFGTQGALDRIENLSRYLASKGDKYKSHYATILQWASKEQGVSNGSNQKHSQATRTQAGGIRGDSSAYDSKIIRLDEGEGDDTGG